eukprot:2798204-Karenia_brevis.AAC.1
MYEHHVEIPGRAAALAASYTKDTQVIDDRLAQTLCGALQHPHNLGQPALTKLQDILAKATAEAGPKEARHNKQGIC